LLIDILVGIVWSGTQLVAIGDAGTILTSPDGVNWTTQSSGLGTNILLTRIAWSGTQFVAVGDLGTIITSPDAVTWTPQISGTTGFLFGVTWGVGQFVVAGENILTSPDGINWTTQTTGSSIEYFGGIAWTGSQFVIVGEEGSIATSPDAITWTLQESGTGAEMTAIVWSGTQLVAVGDGGTILRSGGKISNDVVLNLPSGVTVLFNDNSSSSVLHTDTAVAIATADVDNNGEDDVIASFLAGSGPGGTGGTYISRNGGRWFCWTAKRQSRLPWATLMQTDRMTCCSILAPTVSGWGWMIPLRSSSWTCLWQPWRQETSTTAVRTTWCYRSPALVPST